MSGYEDERPSKRVRRQSRSHSPEDQRQKRETSDVDSKRYKENHEDRGSDRKHHRRERRSDRDDGKSRSITPVSDNDRNQRSERRHRDRHDRSRRHRSRSRDRSTSPRRDSHRHRHRHRDRESRHDSSRDKNRDRSKRNKSPSPIPYSRSKAPLPSQNDAFTSTSNPADPTTPPKQKPNFNPTGKLAALSNTVQTANQTIILKYHEPSEARKPPVHEAWRMYIFKGDEILDTVELATQSCWLFGREAAVADIPVEHPSCSKQHAVIQFRYVEKRSEFGDKVGRVRPYVIDLESANGTKVNEVEVPKAKYVEIKDGDVVKFGESTREYVVQLPPRT